MDITDAIPDMEEADGSAYLLEQLNSAIGNGEFIDKIQYEPHEPGDVLMLTGVGEVFPFMRSIRYWKPCNRIFRMFRFWLCIRVSLMVVM